MNGGMMNGGRAVLAIAARWVARVLSAALLLFWGFFLAAHVLGDAGDSSRSLTRSDYVIVGGLLVSLVGLAVAWRWEAAGAIMALLGVAVGAATNWKVFIFPGVLIPVDALLFITSWWLGRARNDGDALRCAEWSAAGNGRKRKHLTAAARRGARGRRSAGRSAANPRLDSL